MFDATATRPMLCTFRATSAFGISRLVHDVRMFSTICCSVRVCIEVIGESPLLLRAYENVWGGLGPGAFRLGVKST